MHKSILIIAIGRLLQAVLGVVALKLMTSLLSPAEVGNYYLILSVVGFFVLTFISPFGMYVNRRLHKWAADGTVLNRFKRGHLYLLLVSVLSLLASFVMSSLFGVGGTIAPGAFASLVAFYVYFSTANQTIIPSLNMLERRFSFVALTVSTLASGLCLSIYFSTTYALTAVSWITGQAVAMFAVAAAALVYFRRVVSKPGASLAEEELLSRSALIPVLAFAWPLGVTYLFMWAQTMSHRLIIEKMIGPEFLGLIGVGFGVAASMGATLESVIQQFYLPLFYKEISKADTAERAIAWDSMARLTLPLYFSFAILVSCLSPFLLKVFASGHYAKAWVFLLCGAWLESFRMSTNVLSTIAHSEMKTRFLIKSYLIGALISVVGTYLAAGHTNHILLIPAVLVAGGFAVLAVMYFDMRKLMPIRIVSGDWLVSLSVSAVFPLALLFWGYSDSLKVSLAVSALFGSYFIAVHYYLTAHRLASGQKSSVAVPVPAAAAADGMSLTVAIPTFNGAGTIGRTLESVLSQVEPGVELLISDNCSTDETASIVAVYAAKYPCVKYSRNEVNAGYDRNVDLAIHRAGGSFVWLLGDDDVLLPGGIRRVLEIIAANPGCSVIFVNCPHPIVVDDASGGCCPDGEEFFARTKFKSGFVSTNIVNRRLWLDSGVSKYFDSGWIHIGYLIEALQRAPSYVETRFCVDYIRDRLGDMRWGEGGGFMYTGLRLVRIYQSLPALGYSRGILTKALMSVKGGYWRNIPLAKAKGFRTDRAFLADCFRYYKGFFSFWLVDLPILFVPSFIFKGLFHVFKAPIFAPLLRIGRS